MVISIVRHIRQKCWLLRAWQAHILLLLQYPVRNSRAMHCNLHIRLDAKNIANFIWVSYLSSHTVLLRLIFICRQFTHFTWINKTWWSFTYFKFKIIDCLYKIDRFTYWIFFFCIFKFWNDANVIATNDTVKKTHMLLRCLWLQRLFWNSFRTLDLNWCGNAQELRLIRNIKRTPNNAFNKPP